MSVPSVVFVPGSFAPASLYYPLVESVVARGIEAQAINLPTVHLPGDDRIAPSLYDDGDFIASTIEKLADKGRDVIVIGHSYGGIPLSQGTVGLSKPTRAAQGKPGGLSTVAYMTAYVPIFNESSADIQAGGEFELDVTIDEQGWMWQNNRTLSAELTFSELTPEEREPYNDILQAHSARSFVDKATQLGYKDPDISLAYLFAEKDVVIPPTVQRQMIDKLKSTGKTVDVTSIPSDHAPPISQPDLTLEWVLKLANSSVY
ncbi:unnamed protein product [Periconia digitata]|uniref:AB hydrolase-1 domain-containing protein n=1 Tax=Periconia digitata TaxID=1303443 RepID=A0A9W4U8X0_9PLEO|nr:unnamed protein product [Periconia digitata]